MTRFDVAKIKSDGVFTRSEVVLTTSYLVFATSEDFSANLGLKAKEKGEADT